MSFQLTSSIPIWLLTSILIIVSIIGSYYSYRKTNPSITKLHRYILTSLRTLSLVLIVLALFSFEWVLNVTKSKPFQWTFLVDASESMFIKDRLGDRGETVERLLKSVPSIDKQSSIVVADTILVVKSVSEHWKNLSNKAKYSSAERMLDAVKNSEINPNGIFWITDGNFVEASSIPWLPIPTWVLPIGDTTAPLNAYIGSIELPLKFVVGKPVTLKVPVFNNGNDVKKANLKVTVSKGTITEKTITLPINNSAELIEVNISPKSKGWQTLTIELTTDFEENKADNLTSFPIFILPEQQPIWMIYNVVHPDLGAIRQVFQNDSSYVVQLFTMNEFVTQITKPLPETLPILCLFGTPQSGLGSESKISQFIADYRGGVYYFPLTSRPNLQLLTRFTPSQLQVNNENEISAVQVTPSTNMENLMQASYLDWSRLPPVAAMKRKYSANSNIYFIHSLQEPAIIIQTTSKKTALFTVWDIWRWRHHSLESGRPQSFDNWIKSISEVIGSSVTKNLQIIPPKQVMEGIPSTFEIVWYGENGERITNGNLLLSIDGEKTQLVSNPTGKFEINWKPQKIGSSKIVVSGQRSSSQMDTDSIEIEVSNYNTELLNPRSFPNHLKSAQLTGGGLIDESQLNRIIDSLQQTTFQAKSSHQFVVWNSKIALILLLLFLSLEWWLRSRIGMM